MNFKNSDLPLENNVHFDTVLKPDGSDKMVIEECISYNNGKLENRKVETTVSFKDLVSRSEEADLASSSDNKDDDSVRIQKPKISLPEPEPFLFVSPRPLSELDAAAVNIQKVYKSYRTRRRLADTAVVAEELWWQSLHDAALKRSSDIERPEAPSSPSARAKTRVAEVEMGLSEDENAQQLAPRYWLGAIDPRHRYGPSLLLYYEVWCSSESTQPFFYWLDVGDGKKINLEKCPRVKLQKQCLKYLGLKHREAYEAIVDGGNLVYE